MASRTFGCSCSSGRVDAPDDRRDLLGDRRGRLPALWDSLPPPAALLVVVWVSAWPRPGSGRVGPPRSAWPVSSRSRRSIRSSFVLTPWLAAPLVAGTSSPTRTSTGASEARSPAAHPEYRDLTLYYFGDTDPVHYGVVGRRFVIDAGPHSTPRARPIRNIWPSPPAPVGSLGTGGLFSPAQRDPARPSDG
ncbi:MAG: hypothetical protein WKF75_03705 [Singulisphaera sp.]